MDKKKYILVRCDSMKDFEERINENYADGYELISFDVVSESDIMRGYYAVMQQPTPTRISPIEAISG